MDGSIRVPSRRDCVVIPKARCVTRELGPERIQLRVGREEMLQREIDRFHPGLISRTVGDAS